MQDQIKKIAVLAPPPYSQVWHNVTNFPSITIPSGDVGSMRARCGERKTKQAHPDKSEDFLGELELIGYLVDW